MGSLKTETNEYDNELWNWCIGFAFGDALYVTQNCIFIMDGKPYCIHKSPFMHFLIKMLL